MMMISLGCFRPRLLKSRLKKREVESPETDLYTNGVRVAMKKEDDQNWGGILKEAHVICPSMTLRKTEGIPIPLCVYRCTPAFSCSRCSFILYCTMDEARPQ